MIFFLLCTDQDGAEPSPNSTSARNLHRLFTYLPTKVSDVSANHIFKTFRVMLDDHPVALPEMLSAFLFHSKVPKQVMLL